MQANTIFDRKIATAVAIVVILIAAMVYILFVPKGPYVTDKDRAVFRCVFLCKSADDQGLLLDDGPCLSSGETSWDIDDWVCDIVNNPREQVDNLPENQCPEYGRTASHFVELNPNCIFLRAF